MTTRRNGSAKAPLEATESTMSAKPSSQELSPLAKLSKYIPTRRERILLLIYPITLILGSVASILSPRTRNLPYSASSQSIPAEAAPSYFARKSNVFNVFFVKIGWFWITLAFLVIFLGSLITPVTQVSKPAAQGSASLSGFDDETEASRETRRLNKAQSVLRFFAVTAWWIAVTQWFFGPPLIDRSFRWSGGGCEGNLAYGIDTIHNNPEEILSATACKVAGGKWVGGHDISGHVFLLVLGSAFLTFEMLPLFVRARTSRVALEKVGTASTEKRNGSLPWWAWFVFAVQGLCWWMLLMTATYFHTWFEKLTGLVVAFTAIGGVYYLPRFIPQVEAVFGSPKL